MKKAVQELHLADKAIGIAHDHGLTREDLLQYDE